MKCMNCNAEISPQYVHAIANNACPGCGGAIYDDEMKDLYNELKEAMLRMPNDPVGLTGWLLDNYKLSKIGTVTPVEKFYGATTGEVKNKEPTIKAASPEKTNEFFQRAGVSPQTKAKLSKDYSALVDQINNNLEQNMYGLDDEVEMGDDMASPTEDDFVAAKEMNAKFGNEELIVPGRPLGRQEMNELKSLVMKSGSSVADNILESERMDRLQRQENMLSGGGGFKR